MRTSTSLLLLAGWATSSPLASRRDAAVKESHTVPRGWKREERPSPIQTIKLNIGLSSAQGFSELERHLYEVSTPDHPRFGQHLSAAEVHELTRPSNDALAAVRQWLVDYDIRNAQYSAAQDWISVTLPVKKVEEMLSTQYHYYTHSDGERLLRTPSWSLPRHLHEHVSTIQPTNSFFRPQRKNKRPLISDTFTLESVAPPTYSSPGVGVAAVCNTTIVTPTCLRTLYGTINYTVQEAGKNFMALTDYLGELNIRSDAEIYLQSYRPEADAAAYQFSQISINGGTVSQNFTAADAAAGTGFEGALDIQTMMSVAWPVPLVAYSTGGVNPTYIPDQYTGPVDSDEPYITWLRYLATLPDAALPSVVSTSYDDDEQTIPYSYASTACAMFAALGARGVTLLFASGDEGVGGNGDCYSNNGTNATTFLPEFPSTCPYVTSVGATAGFNPEVAVYDAQFRVPFTSGAGFSNYFPRPAYQSASVPRYLERYVGGKHAGLFNAAGRGFPDLAAQGSNFSTIWNGTLNPGSGTSAATPAMGGVLALVNDALIAAGKPRLGFLNPWLYSVGHKAFTDIVSGNSAGCDTDGFPAAKGWDAVTGWGTPRFADILKLRGVKVKV